MCPGKLFWNVFVAIAGREICEMKPRIQPIDMINLSLLKPGYKAKRFPNEWHKGSTVLIIFKYIINPIYETRPSFQALLKRMATSPDIVWFGLSASWGLSNLPAYKLRSL